MVQANMPVYSFQNEFLNGRFSFLTVRNSAFSIHIYIKTFSCTIYSSKYGTMLVSEPNV